MAAHSVTILVELANTINADKMRSDLRQAIGFAPGMDFPQLDGDDYHWLSVACEQGTDAELYNAVLDQLQVQLQQWQLLGRPSNTEDWKRA